MVQCKNRRKRNTYFSRIDRFIWWLCLWYFRWIRDRYNFVFVKLRGKNKGKPLEYQDVSDLFKRLKKKTGIDVHAHLLRHTHATIYYQVTKDIKQVQERLGHSQIQHSQIQTTMNMYLHPSDEDIRANWEIAQPSFNII